MKGIASLFVLLLVSAQASGSGFDTADPVELSADQTNKLAFASNTKLLTQLENVQMTFDKLAQAQSKAKKAAGPVLKEEASLAGKVADLKALKEKMVAVTEDFDAWAAPQTTKLDKLKADIVALNAEIASLKKKQVTLKARTDKANAEAPKVQAEIDTLMAELKAKGAHGMTGTFVHEDAQAAAESDDDTATTLLKSEKKADKEAADDAKAATPGKPLPTGKKAAQAPVKAAAPVMAVVNKTGSMKSSDQPCCVAHKGPLCISTHIAECVCKVRASCCTKSWDLTCVDAVIEQGCGMCNAAALTATPLIDGKLQVGGRTKDQVYLK